MKHLKLFEEDAYYAAMTSGRAKVPTKKKKKRILQIREIAKKEKIPTDGDFIMLFHGTSNKNMDSIVKSGKFNSGTWFAKTFDEAKKYANTKVTDTKNSVATVCMIFMGSLTYNEYFTTQEEVYFKNGKY